MDLCLPSPLQAVNWKIKGENYPLRVKRDDLIHPLVSGNKWRKLRLLLEDAKRQRKTTLVSFGGAWSNHLMALAVAAQRMGFEAVAFIRGEELTENSNNQLAGYKQYGMELIAVNRADYRDKNRLFEKYFGENQAAFFIDEGGASEQAQAGCRDILTEDEVSWDHIWLPVGTGTTLLGLAGQLASGQQTSCLHGVSAVQSTAFSRELWMRAAVQYPHVQIHLPENGPRFGKFSERQLKIGQDWYQQTGILPDPVYGLKTLEALFDFLEKKNPAEIGRVLWIHTGGLTGWAGYPAAAALFRID